MLRILEIIAEWLNNIDRKRKLLYLSQNKANQIIARELQMAIDNMQPDILDDWVSIILANRLLMGHADMAISELDKMPLHEQRLRSYLIGKNLHRYAKRLQTKYPHATAEEILMLKMLEE